MELATGPLPARAPKAIPAGGRADPWGEFLQRVLPSAVDAGGADVLALPEGEDAQLAGPSGRGLDSVAE